jgi:hypothetical protein
MADSLWAIPPSTGMADPELPIPGDPEEEEPGAGGGRGPCCWAIAGIANGATAQTSKRTILLACRWMRDSVASFANVLILSVRYRSKFGLKDKTCKAGGRLYGLRGQRNGTDGPEGKVLW